MQLPTKGSDVDVMRQNRKLQWKEHEARKAAMVKDSANVGEMPGAINDGPSSDPASTDAPSSDSPTNAHSGDPNLYLPLLHLWTLLLYLLLFQTLRAHQLAACCSLLWVSFCSLFTYSHTHSLTPSPTPSSTHSDYL